MNSGKGILLDGVIVNIFGAEIYGNFEKRVMWIKEASDSKFAETWAVEFQQGDCNRLDCFKPGQAVTVTIDIKGKLFSKNGKESVFVTLKANGIQLQGGGKKTASMRQQTGGAGRYSVDNEAYNDGEA